MSKLYKFKHEALYQDEIKCKPYYINGEIMGATVELYQYSESEVEQTFFFNVVYSFSDHVSNDLDLRYSWDKEEQKEYFLDLFEEL